MTDDVQRFLDAYDLWIAGAPLKSERGRAMVAARAKLDRRQRTGRKEMKK